MRETIVQQAVSYLDFRQLQEIKFNLENEVPLFSNWNLEDIQSDVNSLKQCSIEYGEYMSKAGSYGSLFELAKSTQLYNFVAVVFMKQGNIFKCFDIGYTDNQNDVLKPKTFILFTGSSYRGHFRLLKPSTIEGMNLTEHIPRGDYSIFKEYGSSFYLKKGHSL